MSAAQHAEHCRDVAVAAVREFAKELGQMYDPSFTVECERFVEFLRSRDYAEEFRAIYDPTWRYQSRAALTRRDP